MRGWLKATLLITALAIAILAATILLGQYVPQGLGSSLAQSINIAILALGITSSTIAVLSATGIQEYFKRRDQEKRVKSALVSYLAGLPLEILPLASIFAGLGRMHFPKLPKDYPSELDREIQVQVLDIVRRGTPIDASYYERNIRDHLLYLPERMARQAVSVAILVNTLNSYYNAVLRQISTKTVDEQLFPMGRWLSTYLNTHERVHELISQLATDLAVRTQALMRTLLQGRESTEDFRPQIEKIQGIKEELDKAQLEFMKTLFPQANAQPSPSTSPQN